MTALVAVVAALLSALAVAYSAVQSRKVNNATVDIRVFNDLRDTVLAQAAQLRSNQTDFDTERQRRRDLEDQLHRVARALYAAGIDIPKDVADLLKAPRPEMGRTP